MRTLRKDYARYSKEDDIDEMVRVSFSYFYRCSVLVIRVFTLYVSPRYYLL